jgi:uncharacterized protein (TIGR03435 family)
MRRLVRVLILAAVVPVAAQAPPAFEAVSVKRNVTGAGINAFDRRPGRFRTINVPLKAILQVAYGVREYQVIGAPAWLSTDRFDITATEPAGTFSPDQRSAMIRGLLQDRFKLAAHTETRDMPTYALVLARNDGRLGPDLRPVTVDCEAIRKARTAGAPAGTRQPADPDDRTECRGQSNQTDPVRGWTYSSGSLNLAQFTNGLTGFVTRPVFDRTGLAGDYDIRLRFLPEPGAPASGSSGPAGAPSPAADVPSVFTALQEQLGLKLEPTRGPIEVLVIDRVEQPTED